MANYKLFKEFKERVLDIQQEYTNNDFDFTIDVDVHKSKDCIRLSISTYDSNNFDTLELDSIKINLERTSDHEYLYFIRIDNSIDLNEKELNDKINLEYLFETFLNRFDKIKKYKLEKELNKIEVKNNKVFKI